MVPRQYFVLTQTGSLTMWPAVAGGYGAGYWQALVNGAKEKNLFLQHSARLAQCIEGVQTHHYSEHVKQGDCQIESVFGNLGIGQRGHQKFFALEPSEACAEREGWCEQRPMHIDEPS
jgi:hypothetical protein